jgi:hypothetical protein
MNRLVQSLVGRVTILRGRATQPVCPKYHEFYHFEGLGKNSQFQNWVKNRADKWGFAYPRSP